MAGKVRAARQPSPRLRHNAAVSHIRALSSLLCAQGVVQEGAIVRGDLAKMVLGKYCTVGRNVVMHPVFYPRAQGCARAVLCTHLLERLSERWLCATGVAERCC